MIVSFLGKTVLPDYKKTHNLYDKAVGVNLIMKPHVIPKCLHQPNPKRVISKTVPGELMTIIS
jgi:hypothetical protein